MSLAWRTVKAMRHGMNLAWRTAKAMRRGINLAWRIVNAIGGRTDRTGSMLNLDAGVLIV